MDTFDDVRNVPIGLEVVIHLDAGSVAGVVAAIEPEARSLRFTDGRVVSFPEPTEPATEEEQP